MAYPQAWRRRRAGFPDQPRKSKKAALKSITSQAPIRNCDF